MKIEFTGRQTGITADVRRLAERKLLKLGRLLPPGTRAHVVLAADKHRRVAEVSLHARSLDLVATGVSTNPRLSVADAIDRLLRQAQRQRTRRRERKGAATPRLPAVPREAAAPEPRVVRSRQLARKPMTLEEASLELAAERDGVLVFRDASSERLRVLYRRADGRLGLIEPEA
jgi:putative sigma-54 modulation protein